MAASYIEAAVLGRFGGVLKERHTNDGRTFVTLSIAVRTNDEDVPEWVHVSIFEPALDDFPPGLTSGERSYVEGKARISRFEGKDGQHRSLLQITARKFLALDRIGKRKKRKRSSATNSAEQLTGLRSGRFVSTSEQELAPMSHGICRN